MIILQILLVVFLLVAFPLGEIARADFGNGIAVTLADICVSVIGIWYIVYVIRNKGNNVPISFKQKGISSLIQNNTAIIFRKPFILFIGACLLSLMVNRFTLSVFHLGVAFLYLVRWIFYASFLFIVPIFNKQFKQKLQWTMVFSGMVIVGIGYAQFFFYPSLRNLYYLGWDEHLYRMFSSFLDPNFLGGFLVLYFIFILGLFFSAKTVKAKTSFIFLSLFTTIAVFLTYSRSAYLLLFMSLLLFFFFKQSRKIIVFIGFGSIIVAGFVFLLVTRPSEGTNLFRTVSTAARFGSASDAWNIFLKNPIIGVGFDAYRYAQRRYWVSHGNISESGHGGAGADNSFLFVLATTGIVGFSCYVWFLFVLCKNAWERRMNSVYAVVSIVSLIGVSVDSLFINSLFYPFIMGWVWIVYALYM